MSLRSDWFSDDDEDDSSHQTFYQLWKPATWLPCVVSHQAMVSSDRFDFTRRRRPSRTETVRCANQSCRVRSKMAAASKLIYSFIHMSGQHLEPEWLKTHLKLQRQDRHVLIPLLCRMKKRCSVCYPPLFHLPDQNAVLFSVSPTHHRFLIKRHRFLIKLLTIWSKALLRFRARFDVRNSSQYSFFSFILWISLRASSPEGIW